MPRSTAQAKAWAAGGNRVRDAHFTVHHVGGVTEVRVDQQRHGATAHDHRVVGPGPPDLQRAGDGERVDDEGWGFIERGEPVACSSRA